MNHALDHILWAVPDLDEGGALFERLTGASTIVGGSHPGLGTRNRLSGLSDTSYFELIAPDPDQNVADGLGPTIAALPAPKLLTFALTCRDLEAVAAAARGAGVTVEPPVAMSRATPDGVRLEWRVMRLSDPRWPGGLPFFIDWGRSPHPATTTPGGVRLAEFAALDPDPVPLRDVYRAIGCDAPVHGSARQGLLARLKTPNGLVTLT